MLDHPSPHQSGTPKAVQGNSPSTAWTKPGMEPDACDIHQLVNFRKASICTSCLQSSWPSGDKRPITRQNREAEFFWELYSTGGGGSVGPLAGCVISVKLGRLEDGV